MLRTKLVEFRWGESVLLRFRRDFDVYVTCLFALIMAGLFATAIKADLRVALWSDEIFTFHISEQPAISDLFAAIRSGADAQPPLYDLVVRALRPLISNDGLRLRITSTVGIFLMCSCIFVFVRRRLPATYAMVASLAALRLVWPYVSEGRAYGITLGCIGVALVCWQRWREDSRPWIPVAVGISLAAAIAFHYFSVFVICALMAGEVIRWSKVRKIDARMLAALMIPVVILIPHVSLMRGGQALVRNFWSKAQPSTLYEYYLPALFLFKNFLILAFALAGLIRLYAFVRPTPGKPIRPHMTKEEWVAALALVALPALVILASLFTVKMFVDRYVLWSAIGMGICLAVLLHRVLRGSQFAATLLLVPLLLWSLRTVRAPLPSGLRLSGNLQQQIQAVRTEPTPIVIPQLHHFMEIWFYSNDEIRSRLVYFVSPDLEFHYQKSDSASLLMVALRSHVPLGVSDYDPSSGQIRILSLPGMARGDWIVPHLRASNFRFVPIEGADRLYEVQAP